MGPNDGSYFPESPTLVESGCTCHLLPQGSRPCIACVGQQRLERGSNRPLSIEEAVDYPRPCAAPDCPAVLRSPDQAAAHGKEIYCLGDYDARCA